MNFQWGSVDNLLDLLDHAWYGLVLLGVAGIPAYFANRNHKTLRQVRDQVINSHPVDGPNLRDDLDRVITAIEHLGTDVRGLRSDLAEEESRRRDHIQELRDEVTRKLAEVHRRLSA